MRLSCVQRQRKKNSRKTNSRYNSRATDKKENARMADMCNFYGYATANDTVNLQIMVMGNTATGDAIFQYSDKDKNTGILTGGMNGDTLIASYKFMSEGKERVGQLALLKKGDSFSECYGEAEEKDRSMFFKNTGALKFTGAALVKMDCKK
ncbi:MAG: hypothetical protein ACKVOM_13160 [Ferruginibacter sp.]